MKKPDNKLLIFWILITISLALSSTSLYLSIMKDEIPKTETVTKSPEVLQKELLDSVSLIINAVVDKELIYQNIIINDLATKTEKSNAAINYKTEVANALSSIKKLADWKDLQLLNSDILIQYAKLENEYGDRKLAVQAFEYILKHSNHLIFKNEAMNSLAVIYADRSSLLYNPVKARNYQKEIVNIEKKYPSKDRYERLARLYEEWAKTEFLQFNDRDYGNKVLDSAFYCIKKLPDYLSYKDSLLQRLHEIYKYHNDILTSKTITGDYKFYVNNIGEGNAKITASSDHLSLRINYLDGNKLMGQIKGSGNFTDPELMIFDVTFKSYSDKFDTFRDGTGIIELKTAPNFILKGLLKQFGEETVELRLLKTTGDL